MKLDPRIIEGKRPLTCFDIEEARKYVGKLCYVGNSYDCFRDLKNLVEEVILIDVEDCETPFHFYIDNQREFCLPAEWVKSEEPKKKYRPYSLEEFSNIFKVGDLVEFRYKDSDEVKCAMFTGYITDVDRIDDKNPGSCELMLGIFHYSLLSLFKECELFLNGEWQPFGIEVKENEEE